VQLPRHEARQVRHFSVLLLAIIVVGTILTVSYMIEVRDHLRETALDHAISVGTLIAMAALYAINRAGHFRATASIAVMLAVIAILGSAIPQTSQTEMSMLTYLAIPIVLSGLLLSVRFTAVVAFLSTAGVFMFPVFFETQRMDIPLFSTVLISAFVVVAANLRKHVEADRRAEFQRSEERFAHLATHDALTGLPNRRLFDAETTTAIARARRARRMVSVLFADIDNFKEINDALGHAMGDRLLQTIGERLRETLRESDVVCRPGGDEYLVLADSIPSTRGAVRVAEKILHSIRRPIRLDEHEVFVTATVGMSLFPEHAWEPSELVRKADVALYRAKARGKDTFALFAEEMSTNASERLELASDLKRAVEASSSRKHLTGSVHPTR